MQELVEKVNSEWEEIFIQEEDNIRNIFLSHFDASMIHGNWKLQSVRALRE